MQNNLKKIRINFRLSVVEKSALELLALSEQQKESEALRALIREATKARGLWPNTSNQPRVTKEGNFPT